MNFDDFFFRVLPVFFLFFFPALIVFIYLKKKAATGAGEGPLLGSEADLEKAERDLREMPLDIREHLLETHDLVDRYPTRQGYSSFYMEDLVAKLHDQGISSELIFQPAAPLGVADSLIDRQGIFELYVSKSDVERARLILNK